MVTSSHKKMGDPGGGAEPPFIKEIKRGEIANHSYRRNNIINFNSFNAFHSLSLLIAPNSEYTGVKYDMALRIKEYVRKSKEMRETGLIISGQNRGCLSAETGDNCLKSRLNGRSQSDNFFLC